MSLLLQHTIAQTQLYVQYSEVPGKLVNVTGTSCCTKLVGIHVESHLTSECSSSKLHLRGSFQRSSVLLEE